MAQEGTTTTHVTKETTVKDALDRWGKTVEQPEKAELLRQKFDAHGLCTVQALRAIDSGVLHDILAGERNNLIVWNHNQKYRDSTENVNNLPFYPEQAPPDPRCLSYTHDRDFGGFLDYPPGKAEFRSKGWCPPEKACYAQMDRVFSNIDYGLKTDFTLKGWDLKSEL